MNNVILYALARKNIGAVDTAVQELAPGYTFQGSVASTDDLPSSAGKGDLYVVTEDDYNSQYVYDGSNWLFLGRTNIQITSVNENI